MAITVSIGALVQAERVLLQLAQQRVSFKATRHLDRLTTIVQAETALFHKTHDALVRELGQQRDVTPLEKVSGIEGPITEVSPENRDVFVAKITEMTSLDVPLEADAWLLTAAVLDEFRLSREDLVALRPLLAIDSPT